MITHAIAAAQLTEFASDVRAGLTKPGQKELLSKYLYDRVGSTLFEVIGALPEYGLTRADERLLRRHASEIVARLPRPVAVAELGSGSGKKTRWILEAFARSQRTFYYPIEISPTALAEVERELGRMDSVSIVGLEREYLDGLLEVAARRQHGAHLMVLFLGSTVGNFDRPQGLQFLREVRHVLVPGDSLLLGTDLEKPVPQLLDAYDDPLGVTAAFNLNLLARVNRDLDANFDLRRFAHSARFNPEARSVEMHLRSTERQTVDVPGARISVALAKDETIWTESSHKYSPGEVDSMAGQSGFRCDAQWIDREWPFAESLLIAE
ncbi:MAG TPA: L-histidine N(alpha)-methyltransferase [Terriglobia bacterium]|jgi:L-histidine N-alpha-methyltransferase|nr:L-histidine N(alpha)-methyltransferase [Terriglobia bacterium]